MENIKDWCISRQLWWGHRIPAWYDEEGRFVVAATEDEAKKLFIEQHAIADAALKQDEDCLDTWFSSWLWPFEVFKGYSNPGNKEVNYYYPTNTLVTAPEIIFFWVARMIMAGFEYKGEKPFNEVYFTGIVRDKLGRKMSKSLGNSPDLIEMIEKDGADAVRFGIMISSPAGNDLMWDQAGNEQGRFFINKMWNALKLIKMWESRQAETNNNIDENFAVDWFENRLNEVRTELDSQFKDFSLSAALKTIYSLIWDDFCSWYLEWIKPGFEQPIDKNVYDKTIEFFEQLIQILHPFMPFVTEEIYHQLKDRTDDLTVKQYPAIRRTDSSLLANAAFLKEIITTIRDARNKNQLKPKDTIKLHIQTENRNVYTSIESILAKQVNAGSISFTSGSIPNSITVVVQKDKIFIETTAELDTTAQKQQLQKDLDYLKGFLVSVDKKLSNEKFVQNAKPEVIEIERKKKADAEEKIKVIEESLSAL
jgi:valyl-tRNA synthetase